MPLQSSDQVRADKMWAELNLPECQSANIENAVYEDPELPKMQFDITKLIFQQKEALEKDEALHNTL